MRDRTRDELVTRLSDSQRVVEVGIGTRVAVARELARAGVSVTATDVHPREVPPGVEFAVDDVTSPKLSLYADADTIYALNSPPELHRPTLELAREVNAAFLFTTLGGDPAVVPATLETLPGETLFVAE